MCTRVLSILLFSSYLLIKIPIFPIFSILSFLFSDFFGATMPLDTLRYFLQYIKMIASYLALFHELQNKKHKMLKKKKFKTLLFMFKEYTRVFSHDVTAAILVSQNNETAAMLVSQTNPLGVQLFSHANAFCCSNKFCIDAGHVSENTL